MSMGSTRQGFKQDRLDRIVRGMHRFVASGSIPGFVVAISRSGETVLLEAEGEMDLEAHRPMERDTLFKIFSMTKPVTAVTAMTLYEEGHFTLNTPVSEFIPGFADLRVVPTSWNRSDTPERSELEPLARPVTMRHLFTHTAGLSYPQRPDDPVDRAYMDVMRDGYNKTASNESVVDLLTTMPLRFQPGTGWRYSLAIDVIGRVVEIITGMTLDRAMQDRLFGPLDMQDTGFCVAEQSLDRVANIYEREERGAPLTLRNSGRNTKTSPPSWLSGGGGLISTAVDYGRFASMLASGGTLHGRRVLAPSTVRLFSMNQMPDQAPPIGDGPEDLFHAGYGFSLGTRVLLDVGSSGQAGNVGEFGWDGLLNGYFWVDPTLELSAVFLTHHFPYGMDPLFDTYKTLVYAALDD